MIDPTLKEELIRARLTHVGFDLEREPGGFDWDRPGPAGGTAMPALEPTMDGCSRRSVAAEQDQTQKKRDHPHSTIFPSMSVDTTTKEPVDYSEHQFGV